MPETSGFVWAKGASVFAISLFHLSFAVMSGMDFRFFSTCIASDLKSLQLSLRFVQLVVLRFTENYRKAEAMNVSDFVEAAVRNLTENVTGDLATGGPGPPSAADREALYRIKVCQVSIKVQ